MRLRNKGRSAIGLLVSASALLATPACVPIGRVSDDAIRYNEEVEQTQNHIVLLNIVRASMSRPLHFTTFSVLRNRPRVTTGAGLSVPFGGAAPDSFELTPSLQVEQSPFFDIAVLDSQEFLRGLLAQIDVLTLNYYVQQRLPDQLLYSLLFEKIVVTTDAGSETFANDPGERASFERFQAKLRSFVEQGLTTEPTELVRDIGPLLDATEPGLFPELVRVESEGLVIERVDRNALTEAETEELRARNIAQPYRLRNRHRTFRLCFQRPRESLPREAACHLSDDRAQRGRGGASSFREGDARAFSYGGGRPASFAVAGGRIDIHVRSIEGIIRYPGEVVRVQDRPAGEGGYRPTIPMVDGGAEPLFLIEAHDGVAAARDGFIAVVHDGRAYSIPDGAANTAQVLALVSQLLAQSRSVRDLPPTGSVTIIGD